MATRARRWQIIWTVMEFACLAVASMSILQGFVVNSIIVVLLGILAASRVGYWRGFSRGRGAFPRNETEWAKAFRFVFSDGSHVDAVQFPSGRCVVDDPEIGLLSAAVSLEELPQIKNGLDLMELEWEKS